MKSRVKYLLMGAACSMLTAGLVSATPSSNVLVNKTISVGAADNDLHANGTVQLTDSDFTAQVHTFGESNIVQAEVTFDKGGGTGWHKHPGVVILTLAADSGPVDWYDARCGKTVYKAGDSWTEGNKLHDVVTSGSTPAHFFVTYLVPAADPVGSNRRTDEPAPRCAVALGLQ